MRSMRVVLVGTLLLGVLCCQAVRTADADTPVWKPLADGKTQAGWHKNGDGEWTVEDSAFVGRSNNAKLYGHLVSDDKFKDFTVRFKFQCPSGDSGFFIRTEMQEPDKTMGLQIQVGPCGSGTGGIYESYGRGWLQKPTLEQEKACYREGAWNEMIISAHGPHVIVHVNGVKTADLTDEQLAQHEGVFALQMHSGAVNETRFKDLAILAQGEIIPKRFLYTTAPAVKAAADGSLSLHAAAGVGIGPSIRYLTDAGAFGWFTDKDRIEWPLEVAQGGPYDVWLEWSVADDHAGNPYVLEIGDQQVSGTVEKTGSWQTYKKVKIGQLKLQAGSLQAVLKARGTFDNALLSLREIKLVPVRENCLGAREMSRPEERGSRPSLA